MSVLSKVVDVFPSDNISLPLALLPSHPLFFLKVLAACGLLQDHSAMTRQSRRRQTCTFSFLPASVGTRRVFHTRLRIICPPLACRFWGLLYLSMVRALSRTLSPQRPSLELEACFRHRDPPVSTPVFIAKCLFLVPWPGFPQNLGGSRPTVTIIYIYFPFTKNSVACESRASRACLKPVGYINLQFVYRSRLHSRE